MSNFQTSIYIRQILRTDSKWSYDAVKGATITYWLGPLKFDLMFSPVEMAAELKRQGIILNYYEGVTLGIKHEEGVGDEQYESLVSFMERFSQRDWIDLITNIEFNKAISKAIYAAKEYSLKRYTKESTNA